MKKERFIQRVGQPPALRFVNRLSQQPCDTHYSEAEQLGFEVMPGQEVIKSPKPPLNTFNSSGC